MVTLSMTYMIGQKTLVAILNITIIQHKIAIKLSGLIAALEYHWMEQVCGVLVMTLLEILQFLVLKLSSSHTDKRNHEFLVLGGGPIQDINASFAATEQKFSISFTKTNSKFCLSLNYIGDNNYLFVNGIEILNFKPIMGLLTF